MLLSRCVLSLPVVLCQYNKTAQVHKVLSGSTSQSVQIKVVCERCKCILTRGILRISTGHLFWVFNYFHPIYQHFLRGAVWFNKSRFSARFYVPVNQDVLFPAVRRHCALQKKTLVDYVAHQAELKAHH